MDLDDELRKLFADDRLEVRVRPEADRAIVTGARRIRRRRAGVVFGGGMLSVVAMLVAGTAFGVGGDAPHQIPLAITADSSAPVSTTTPPPATTSTTAAAPTTAVESVAPTTARLSTTKPPPTTTTSMPPSTTKAKPPVGALLFGPTTVNGLRLGMTVGEAIATGLVQSTPGPVDYAGCQGYKWSGRAPFGDYYSLLFSPKYGLVRIGGIAEAETPEGIYAGSTDADVRAAYPTQSKSHIGDDWVTPVPGNATEHYWFILSDHVVTELRLELATQDCYQ
ncbi:hypothetical protein [Kutzneria sp. CA-103260]|uniref:hypothetical protein n=1 Tax=Kutzneria sp. CA-103260 TaxID=2802641 RepID=UPI001BA9EE48|nr:hypothetical protein [Kutzneria sp. CA-103260]QUQ69889.1 hypothetical protein JJ691_76560 [Kutzneria sp. CA-103260]